MLIREIMKTVYLILFFFLSIAIELHAQVITNHDALFMPQVDKPEVGIIFLDPVFNTPVKRLTNAQASGWPGCVPQYSKRQAWNADGSRMILTVEDGYFGLFDGNNYSFIKRLDIYGEDVFWHPTDPDNIIFCDGNLLVSYTVSTDEKVVIREFPEYEWCNTRGEGNLSNDGRYYAFVGQLYNENTGDVIIKDIIIFDFKTNSVISTTPLPDNFTNFDWVSISPLGNYVVIDYADDTIGRYHGVEVFDLEMNLLWQKPLGWGHSDLGVDANGDEVLIMDSYDPNENTSLILKYRLSDGLETLLLKGNYIDGHISCRNQEPQGWCLISSWDDEYRLTVNEQTWEPFENEVYWLKMDGSGDVKRIAHHHSRRFSPETPNPDSSNYWAEPHATVNKKGTKVIWGSNWEMNMSEDWSVDTYLADVSGFFTTNSAENFEQNEDSKIHNYPNPTSGIFQISTNELTRDDYAVEVFNSLGGLIYKATVQKSEMQSQVDLSGYSSGIYLLKIQSGNKFYQSKVIKK
jgi:hypothetical protein